MSSIGLTAGLIDIISVFMIAAAVGIAVHKIVDFPYTIALLIAGFFAGLAGIHIGIELSHDIILLVLLPPLLFEGAASIDLEKLRSNLIPILLLAVPGLIISILFLGFITKQIYGFPIIIALLFATIILPTDPVSVLAIFEEVGAPESLSTLVEGESLVNDGVSVVIYSTLLALAQSNRSLNSLISLNGVVEVSSKILMSSLGGAVVGLITGYVVYRIMANIDEHKTEIILTIILAYGSFILAEHYLHVSGVIATVAAALLIGNRGSEYAMSPQTRISVFNTWDTGAFIVNTFIFVLIGVKTPLSQILKFIQPLLLAIPLVLIARAISVYSIINLSNIISKNKVSFSYQHILFWGGIHASIPIALALGLPPAIDQRNMIRAIVFGVAGFGLIIQGLSMRNLIKKLDIGVKEEEKRIYELLIGRARAVESALDSAESLVNAGHIPETVYKEVKEDYEREKQKLSEAISNLMKNYPGVEEEQKIEGERKVLKREKSAIISMMRTGEISDNIGEKLLKEIDLKLDKVRKGESTISKKEERSYEESWYSKAEELDLISEEEKEGKEQE